MTVPADICNLALSEIAARENIASLEENSNAAATCKLWYDRLRKQLLRGAPWGFARTQIPLTQTGSYSDNTSPFPYLYKYAYPADCLKLRYVLCKPANNPTGPQVDVGPVGAVGWVPSRTNRFLIHEEPTATTGVYNKVIVTNVQDAIGVYTLDVTNCDKFDPLFEGALIALLASKLVMPISGDLALRERVLQTAQAAVNIAREADASEALPTTDHMPDWIGIRGLGGSLLNPMTVWGQGYSGYDEVNWGM